MTDDPEAVIAALEQSLDDAQRQLAQIRSAWLGSLSGDPVALARQAYRARRIRDAVFSGSPGHLAEPAWDLLLDLYVARAEEKRVSVTSACIAAAAPPTTALRVIAALEQDGLIERQRDPADRRRSYVALTARASAMVEQSLVSGRLHPEADMAAA